LLDRFWEGQGPELITERAEWYALVKLGGHLQRAGASEIQDYDRVVAETRRQLEAYDGIPF